MADAIEFVKPLLSQKMSITEEDIIKISKAVKAEILADINKLIHARTEPLVQKISKLETENKQLQKDLDALEQDSEVPKESMEGVIFTWLIIL